MAAEFFSYLNSKLRQDSHARQQVIQTRHSGSGRYGLQVDEESLYAQAAERARCGGFGVRSFL